MVHFSVTKIFLATGVGLTGLMGCQSSKIATSTTAIPATSVSVPASILPNVIVPKVVKTLVKDPAPPKAVVDGDIVPAVGNITPEQLASYHWKLIKATDSDNKEILPLSNYLEKNNKIATTLPRLDFNIEKTRKRDDTGIGLNYTMGCNLRSTSKYLVNNVLTSINNLSISTMIGCGDLDIAETQLSALMGGTSQLSMRQGDIAFLTQITKKNATLIWQGTPTARNRYNQEPQRVFLAVAPDTQFCDDKTARQCLQIKPVTYVDNKKVVTGDWLLLDGPIEGYNPIPNQAQVIRVERYPVVSTPSKPSHYVYVLDQIIESTVVNN